MSDYYQDTPDGIQPRTAGIMLAVLALLGVGLFTTGVLLDRKSADPLYDPDNQQTHTSSQLQTTQDLWKKKQPLEAPSAEPAQPAPPTPPQPARPTSKPG